MRKIAAHVAEMRRQQSLARIAHTKIEIELGAEAHQPKNAIGQQANLIGALRKRDNEQKAHRQDEQLMP